MRVDFPTPVGPTTSSKEGSLRPSIRCNSHCKTASKNGWEQAQFENGEADNKVFLLSVVFILYAWTLTLNPGIDGGDFGDEGAAEAAAASSSSLLNFAGVIRERNCRADLKWTPSFGQENRES